MKRVVSSLILTIILVPLIVFESLQWTQAADPRPIDFNIFGPAGGHLLTGTWSGVYANPVNQGGPFELIVYGVPDVLGLHTITGWTIFFTIVSAILTFGVILAFSIVRGDAPLSPSWLLALAVCSIVVLAGYIPSALFLGHPAEVAIPVLWLFAAYLVRGRHFVACGVVIALSTGWEVWGLLGAPVIFLAAKPGLVKAALGGVAGLVVLFVPFIATGVFAMFSFDWPVASTSLFHAIAPQLQHFPWSLRLVQAVVALGAGVAVAFLTRASRYAVWLVPLAILTFRLALDPVLAEYYWIAPAIVMIGFLAHLLQDRRWLLAAVTVLGVIAFATPATNFIGAIVFALLILAVAGILKFREKAQPVGES